MQAHTAQADRSWNVPLGQAGEVDDTYRIWSDYLTEHGGGGFFHQGMNAIDHLRSNGQVPLENKFTKSNDIRKGARQATTPAAKLKGTVHAAWRDLSDPYRIAWDSMQDWGNWDVPKNTLAGKGWATDAAGNLTGAGKVAGTLMELPGKALHLAGPAMDVLDFGTRIAAGENVARAGAGAGGSIVGWSLGAAAGSAILPGIGTIVGGVAGSMLGDKLATMGYEALSEDGIEQARKIGNGEQNAASMNGAQTQAMQAAYLSALRNTRSETLNRVYEMSNAQFYL